MWQWIAIGLLLVACKAAPARLEIPVAVQDYICDAKAFYTTILPVYSDDGGMTAWVAFYVEPGKSDESYAGIAIFQMYPRGTLGEMLTQLGWRREVRSGGAIAVEKVREHGVTLRATTPRIGTERAGHGDRYLPSRSSTWRRAASTNMRAAPAEHSMAAAIAE